MDDGISIHLFCLFLDSRLGLLLRLMKVLLAHGLLGHAAWDCRLGWLRDGSDGSVLLLRLLFRVGCHEKAGNHRCVAALVWLFSSAWEAAELTPLAWTAPRWRGRHHFQFTRNVGVEWFCLICCNLSTKQPFSRFAF